MNGLDQPVKKKKPLNGRRTYRPKDHLGVLVPSSQQNHDQQTVPATQRYEGQSKLVSHCNQLNAQRS